MEKYKVDRKRGYESNRRNIDLEGRERQRAKKEAKAGLSDPTPMQIKNDVQQYENDRELLNDYLADELGEILAKELNKK